METQELIITVLGLASMSYLWVFSEPTDTFMRWLIKRRILKDNSFIHRLITCPMCFGFWLSIILVPISFSFPGVAEVLWYVYMASIVSLLSYFVTRKIND